MKKVFILLLIIPVVMMGQSDSIVFRQQLDSVVIRALPAPVKQHANGIVINPQTSLLTNGSNVLQTLERAPGVAIDRRNGLSLNGKTGVRVMLDGRSINLPEEQITGFLEGLNAENIERIELLTTPAAGVDAEGGAGVINIIRKKNRKHGTSGSATVSAGYGYYEKLNARFQLAHRIKKINLYGNYAIGYDRSYSDMFIPSEQDMPVYGGKLRVLVFDTSRSKQISHDATVGMDITLNANTTIGGSLMINNSLRNTKTLIREDFFIEPDSALFFLGRINAANRWNNLLQNVYLQKTKGTRSFTITADHLLFRNSFPTDIVARFTDRNGNNIDSDNDAFAARQQGSGKTRIRVGVIKVDYAVALGKTRLETGIKATWTQSNSEAGISGRAETMNKVEMNESIGAGYVSVSRQLGASTDMIAGVRYEYTSLLMDNPETGEKLITRKNGNLFPNLSFLHRFGDKRSLSLSWTKRITRPAYTDLASYIRYNDPTAVYVGNPLLKPSVTNNIDVRFSLKDFSFALLMSRDQNMLVRYQITENPARTLLYVSPQNLAWQNNILLQTTLPFSINSWWNMSTTLTGGWKQFRAVHTLEPVTKAYVMWSVNGMHTFLLPKKYSAELSGWFNGRSFNGSIQSGAVGVLNAGLKKELNRSRGTLQFTVSDILTTMKFTSMYGAVTREAFDIKNKVQFYSESAKTPIFRISYSRTLGSLVSRNRSAGASSEERGRVNNE